MFRKIVILIFRNIHLLFRGRINVRLGYDRKAKLLMIHADDLGFSHSENKATINAMNLGMVNSASIMVPCPAFAAAAASCKGRGDLDIGLHATLTSEWDLYKWGALTKQEEVPGLLNKDGFFHNNKPELSASASDEEIEKEIRKQLDTAKEAGLELTHIDTHMFISFSDKRIMRKCLKLGKEFGLPVLLTYELPLPLWFLKKNVVTDKLYCAKPENFKEGLDRYYSRILDSLEPGLNIILIHAGFDNDEMKKIFGNRTDFGSAWRQADFDFFTSAECRRLLDKNNIKLVNWRDIRNTAVKD